VTPKILIIIINYSLLLRHLIRVFDYRHTVICVFAVLDIQLPDYLPDCSLFYYAHATQFQFPYQIFFVKIIN